MFKKKSKTEDEFLGKMSTLVDYIGILDKLNKCDNPDILDMVINVCKARKKEL